MHTAQEVGKWEFCCIENFCSHDHDHDQDDDDDDDDVI